MNNDQHNRRDALPTGYVLMPERLTAENGAKSALSGEFHELTDIECPECLGNGDDSYGEDCPECNGDGKVAQRVTVEWDTIKRIYAKAVEVCAHQSPVTRPADAAELHFNATRLRNVAKLVGLESAVPDDDATLDGARGSVLGMISGTLRAALATSATDAKDVERTQATRDVLAERRRQIEVEGWTTTCDDEHSAGQMARAAACYAAINSKPVPSMWPWAPEWWKPRDDRRNLIKAAALIIAEIERLDRAANATGKDGV